MASVEVGSLSADAKDQLVCTYAALLLHDGGLDIDVSRICNLKPNIFDLGQKIEPGYQGKWKHCRILLARPLRKGPRGIGY